jgi:hypothetical protein
MKIPRESKTNTNPKARNMELMAPRVSSMDSFRSFTFEVLV